MKKQSLSLLGMILLASLLSMPVLAYKGNGNSEGMGRRLEVNDEKEVQQQTVRTNELELNFTNEEKEDLVYMRQEEKLARDVYLALYDKWHLPIFQNIASSEQRHTDMVKNLLVKSGEEDPITDDSRGVFKDQSFVDLYNSLVKKGSNSEVEALKVGATIEDLDIKDLEDRIAKTTNQSIINVYTNLMNGSKNHLRAFVTQLKERGEGYTPQYISQEEYEKIISSEITRGGMRNREVTLKEARNMLEKGKPALESEEKFGLGYQNRAVEQLKERLHLSDDDKVSISHEENQVKVQVKKEVKLLGLFKVNLPIEVEFDQEGKIQRISKPWWAFWIRL